MLPIACIEQLDAVGRASASRDAVRMRVRYVRYAVMSLFYFMSRNFRDFVCYKPRPKLQGH